MNDPTTQAAREALATARAHEFFRQWWFSLLVMLLITATTWLPESAIDSMALVSTKVDQGEWWRIVTSQFVHLGFNHTLLNIVGYLIVSAAFREDVSAKEEAITLLFAVIGVGLGIYWLSDDIQWYVGLSGAVYGILCHYLIIGWRRSAILSLFFAVFLAGKFIHEQFISGPDTVTASFIGAQVAIDSHLYGAITGLLTGLISFFLFHRHAQPTRAA
jgi:rhomboid family GlyGly-CTERM serine protease